MDKKYLSLIFVVVVLIIFLFIFVFPRINQNEQACLSLTFDDGFKSHYEIVYPLLMEKNFGASFFIVANESEFMKKFIEEERDEVELMVTEQVKELYQKGFEIGSHTLTHPRLSNLNEEELGKELKKSKEILEEKYEININSLAIPYHDSNEKVLDVAKKYYFNARTVYNKYPVGFLLESFGLQKNTSVTDLCETINYAKENKLWFILVFHDISDSPTQWDTSINDFEEILNCADESGIIVDSLDNCKKIIK